MDFFREYYILSHFAKIEDGIVTQVIVAEADFIAMLSDASLWVQTSYNTRGGIHYGQDGNPDGGVALRGNYAGIGYIYDATNDVFYPPKPFLSWILNTNTWLWESPIPYPNDGKRYIWDESTISWIENNGI
jgi:hypothetical protein